MFNHRLILCLLLLNHIHIPFGPGSKAFHLIKQLLNLFATSPSIQVLSKKEKNDNEVCI